MWSLEMIAALRFAAFSPRMCAEILSVDRKMARFVALARRSEPAVLLDDSLPNDGNESRSARFFNGIGATMHGLAGGTISRGMGTLSLSRAAGTGLPFTN
jgi:hypothetical protein